MVWGLQTVWEGAQARKRAFRIRARRMKAEAGWPFEKDRLLRARLLFSSGSSPSRPDSRPSNELAICQSFGRSEIPSSCSSESECELKMHGWVVFFVILRFSFCHGSREEPERTSNDHGQYCTMQRGMFYLCTCLCHVDTLPMTASDLVAVSSRCTDSPEALRSRCSEKAGTCPHALHAWSSFRAQEYAGNGKTRLWQAPHEA